MLLWLPFMFRSFSNLAGGKRVWYVVVLRVFASLLIHQYKADISHDDSSSTKLCVPPFFFFFFLSHVLAEVPSCIIFMLFFFQSDTQIRFLN